MPFFLKKADTVAAIESMFMMVDQDEDEMRRRYMSLDDVVY